MKIIKSAQALRSYIGLNKFKNLGFVPTMGALHQGHLSLIEASIAQNEATVVSIYVNPIQFDKKTDLQSYPRNIQKDIDILTNVAIDILYTPTDEQMYPETPTVGIQFGALAGLLEGRFRSGHFDGVGLVVAKLLHQVSPDRAYFGLKDFQQYSLIKQMVRSLDFNCEIIGMPIVRESSGLALSSRNQGLSSASKAKAVLLYKTLEQTAKLIRRCYDESDRLLDKNTVQFLVQKGATAIINHPDFELDYFELVDRSTLIFPEQFTMNTKAILCVAATLDGVRLIDNLFLSLD